MPGTLILKRAPIGQNVEDYDVLEDGVIVEPHLRNLALASWRAMT